MTLTERYQWAYGAAALLTTVAYVVWLAVELTHAAAADIDYVRPLLITLLASFLIHSFGRGAAKGTTATEDAVADERDREITQRGDALTFYVFSGLAAIPLVLGMLGAHPFWITNALYLAFALAAVFGVVVKTVLYGHRSQEN